MGLIFTGSDPLFFLLKLFLRTHILCGCIHVCVYLLCCWVFVSDM